MRTITKIKNLFLEGKMTECLRAIEAEEERLRILSSKGGASKSAKKSEAARKRWAARSAVSVDLYADNPPEFVGTAKEFAGFRNLSKLPPGVKLGSDLEARS